MPSKRSAKRPRRRTPMGWKPDRSLIPLLLRWFLLLAWLLLIVTSRDELQNKAIQVVTILMEMLTLSACKAWPC